MDSLDIFKFVYDEGSTTHDAIKTL